ncbi:MAG: hypothetical protein NZ578_05085 [Candidatus Binatia bacterium]|nr:hypothetical protein [Candidatus Binatia bacterium]
MGASRLARGAWKAMRHILFLLYVVGMNAGLASSTFADSPCLAAAESPESEFRHDPLKIKLSGFVNTKPEASSLGLVKFGISSYRTSAYFEVVVAEAPDCPRASHTVILQQTGKHEIDFHLFGPKALLLKVAAAEPGTPLAIVGFFQPRSRSLHLESVEVIGMER